MILELKQPLLGHRKPCDCFQCISTDICSLQFPKGACRSLFSVKSDWMRGNCGRGDLDWIPGKISSLLMQIWPCSSCFFCVKVLKIKIKFLWGLLIWGFFNPLKMKAPVRFPHFRKMKFHKYFQGAILRRAEVSQCCTSEVKVSVQAPERRNLGAMVMGAFI